MQIKNMILVCTSLHLFSLSVMANEFYDEEEFEEELVGIDIGDNEYIDLIIGDGTDTSSPASPVSNEMSSRGYYYEFPDQTSQAYAQVDFLYWTVSETGLYYALTKTKQVSGAGEVANNGGSGSILGNGKRHDVNFEWTPGVRASIGYAFTNTPWYVNSEYTYYNINRHQTIDAPQGPFAYLTGLSMLQGTDTNCVRSTSEIHFQYQTARMVFGGSWHPVEKIGMHFEVGPKFTIVNQNWEVTFFSNGAVATANEANHLNWDYWGGGLNLLLGFDANLGMGFGIDSGASVSALFGPFKSHFYNNRVVFGDGGSQLYNIKRDNYSEILWESQVYANGLVA